jgi:hypothetical protein
VRELISPSKTYYCSLCLKAYLVFSHSVLKKANSQTHNLTRKPREKKIMRGDDFKRSLINPDAADKRRRL